MTPSERQAIRDNIVPLMISLPPLLQRQVSDTLAIISRCDFPEAWPNVLEVLVAQLQSNPDQATLNGILETALAIFEPFRGGFADDEDTVKRVLKAEQEFAPALMEVFAMVDTALTEMVARNAGKEEQVPLYTALNTMAGIFYLLTNVDLPGFFEESLETWMGWFHKYLNVHSSVVSADLDDDDQEGLLEQLQGTILESVAIFSDKYDDDFEPYFVTFVEDVWRLLCAQSSGPGGGGGGAASGMSAPRMDNLVVRALRYLASVAGKERHRDLFLAGDSIASIFQGIVVPNMRLRASDVEVFEDEPVDFVSRDIEGGDADTRRRMATDLVRSLCRTCNEQTVPIAEATIKQLLDQYETNREAYVIEKDAAIALMMAMAIRGSTEAEGGEHKTRRHGAWTPQPAWHHSLIEHLIPLSDPNPFFLPASQ